ncbi:hypothetical protein Leryth_006208 [Lithospermum erythrorhizon]|nr:hypothetical protein Leryth_006208 [Lithospermum erythrorhizon]
MVTTCYRILCHDMKAGGVIGKSGSIIKAIRQHTGAWVNVHELIPGDEERIIEISDTRRRDPEGRMPAFSPSQEALLLIHERILESDINNGGGSVGPDGSRVVVTRLVVSRMHVGSILGKGGKIIEQMRNETKTHIRILPRDHTLPRCVSMAEEIVQVVGDLIAVKNAVEIISLRLRESQHRDRTQIPNRLHSPDRFGPQDEDFIPPMGNTTDRVSADGPMYNSRSSGNFNSNRSNNNSNRSSGYDIEPESAPVNDNVQSFSGEELIFRILCPIEKIDNVIGDSDGIMDLLQNEIGVEIKIGDPVSGAEEQIITISSEEGPDDELFPAQEALLHIQTRIVDLIPGKENVITTRILVQSDEVGCLEGSGGSLSEIRKLSGADVQILRREELPVCVLGSDEIIQIEGEIKAAREALLEVTSRLRSYIYRDFCQRDMGGHLSVSSPMGSSVVPDAASGDSTDRDNNVKKDPPLSTVKSTQVTAAKDPVKESISSNNEAAKHSESEHRETKPSGYRLAVPLVTRSILEVVIPPYAATKLVTKSKNKLAQISELSGANVKLVEDGNEATERVVQISGTPEQAERAQSLLQGFILSIEEDVP